MAGGARSREFRGTGSRLPRRKEILPDTTADTNEYSGRSSEVPAETESFAPTGMWIVKCMFRDE